MNPPLQRRTFLKAGALAGCGLTFADHIFRSELARAQTGSSPSDTNCIMLYMTGGPAQQETFDMKPDADDPYRGEFLPVSTNVPGIQVCEHLPMMSRVADKYAVIRSTWHESNTHGVGVVYNLTGLKHAPRQNGEPQVSRDDPPSVGGQSGSFGEIAMTSLLQSTCQFESVTRIIFAGVASMPASWARNLTHSR